MSFAFTILGGIGVFLLGMKLMSENLRDAAGDALRVLLARFTTGKFSSVATGTIFTALVQSSSATTLAVIGFVSAGLLTFSQAVGVIFGANLGTTATSWLVAMVGFRISINAFALPMVGVGALANLLLKGRKAHFGAALAGFGLIFIGIDILQVGMGNLADDIDLSGISAGGIGGRLLLVLIGIVMTVLMQSSSAAIAATLTALYAGAIGIDQAATLVIGQSVGTTVTAGLAAIGSSLAAKRTAAAHIVFNVITALLALLVLPFFLQAHGWWISEGNELANATAIAIFHTAFKVLGVAVLLPVLDPFSRLVTKIVPGQEARYGEGLDPRATAIPAIAVAATIRAQEDIFQGMVTFARSGLLKATEGARNQEELAALELGLLSCRQFLDQVRTDPDQPDDYARHLSVLHALDHLERMRRALDDAPSRLRTLELHPPLQEARKQLQEALTLAESVSTSSQHNGELEVLAKELAEERRVRRHSLLEASARGEFNPSELDRMLQALLWCDRVAFHLWRSTYYLEGGLFSAGQEPAGP